MKNGHGWFVDFISNNFVETLKERFLNKNTILTGEILAIGFIFLILQDLYKIFQRNLQKSLMPPLHSILADLSILVVLWFITSFLYYLNIIPNFENELNIIIIGFALFISIWLFTGFSLVLIGNMYAEKWKNILDGKINAEGNSFIEEILEIKKGFTKTNYQPCPIEMRLDDGFDFGEYLCKSLGKVIKESFHVTWMGFIVTVIIILLWRIVLFMGNQAEIVFLWIIPAFEIFTSIIFLMKLKSIYKQLIPQDKARMSLTKNLNKYFIESTTKYPSYLDGVIPNIEISEPRSRLFLCQINPFKLSCCYIFQGRPPNRHELLFWFDSFGPRFLLYSTQGLLMVSSLWITSCALIYIPSFYSQSNINAVLFSLSFFIWLLLIWYLIPSIIYWLVLTTKIELMKDQKIINEIICESLKNKVKRTVRIYRQLKMIYRDIKRTKTGEEKISLLNNMDKFVEETFFLVASTKLKIIPARNLEKILDLFGMKLNRDELRLFCKECSPDENDNICICNFKSAIERFLLGYELRPYEATKFVFETHFKLKGEITISLKEIRNFFNLWIIHFGVEDINGFICDVKGLEGSFGQIKIEDIASMVQTHVAFFNS
ncbi:unnamed protein product [Blepharisma stoltei]|uniref:Gustatory receptor n=1 Tax=Blepharisma stoltei TaxID=1481888 RepID=A0AAU9IPE7_9CILI|nr:unnamed protein product [Blepharisma stoltei]